MAKRSPENAMAARMAEVAIDIMTKGADPRWLWLMGWRDIIIHQEGKKIRHFKKKMPPGGRIVGQVTGTGPSGVRTAVIGGPSRGDPWTVAICLAFASFGPFWPQVVPGLLKSVDRAIKAKYKPGKAPWQKPSTPASGRS